MNFVNNRIFTTIADSPKNKFIFIVLLIIIGLYIYANSIEGKFIWDDNKLIMNNLSIRHWPSLTKIFTNDIFFRKGFKSSGAFSIPVYRPFQMFTYMVDYSIWGLNVVGYHFTNIILHILVALSVYWFINLLMSNQILSLFTSILFIVHPVHTEAVSYMSGRAESLAALFILLSFVWYIKYTRLKRISAYILMLVSFCLALLSKEYSLILPALLLLYNYTFKQKVKNIAFFSILAVASLYILLRLTILKTLLPSALHVSTFFQRVPGFFAAITNYMRVLFLPLNLHMEYGTQLFNIADPKAITGVLILFSLLFYALLKRKSNRLVFFSIFWFFIALLPFSNLYPINAYMAEHWLYFPSIGFFLLMANSLNWLYQHRAFKVTALIVTITLLFFYSHLTMKQNEYWKDQITFYQRTLKYAPYSWRLYNNLGNAYLYTRNYKEAIASYNKAIEINHDYLDAYNNLGVVYSRQGRYDAAIAACNKAIEINPDYADAYNNLGVIYCKQGRYDEGLIQYKKALEIDKDNIEAHSNLNRVYKIIGKSQ